MIPSLIGRFPPQAVFAELVGDEVRTVTSSELFKVQRAVVIGVPGAFTPVCTQKHLPDFVAQAPRLVASGIDLIACVTPNDPWVNAAWSKQIDPRGKIRMLSDGNLDFCRALGLTGSAREWNLGERSRRYLMQLRGGRIDRISVERSILEVACTRPADLTVDV
ncbi:MAG: peroxiredoxin [Caulobacterales bacterium]|nr:peroxiredoxin [Caulobacterales bacterium]